MINKFFGLFIFIILLIISIYKINIITIGLLIFILVYLIIKKQNKLILIYLIIGSLIYLSSLLNENKKTCNFNEPFKVVEVHENYALVSQNNQKYLIYQDDYPLRQGNTILIKGTLKEISKNGIPYLFSFDEYMSYKNVYYEIDYEYIKITNNSLTLSSLIKNILVKDITYSKDYINLLLFNSKSSLIDPLYDNLIKISAVQLFVISGFHISFFKKIIDNIIKKITKKENNIISISFIFFYLYLLNFTLSSLRAFLSIVFNLINRKYKLNYSSIDINSFIGILFLLFNPKTLFLINFELSFIVVITLSLISNVKNKKSKLLGLFLPFFVSLPLIINMNSEIGIINIFMNYLLTPLVTVLFVISIITLLFPFLDIYLFYVILGFNELIDNLSKLNIYLSFPYLSLSFLIIFYILVYNIILNSFKNKKNKFNMLLISLYLLTWYIKPFSDPYIMFLDVGQGDSCLIHGKNNEYNILVDTGGSIYSDIATKKLIPYFKKEGIKKLDLVIISHLDYDHYGALESLNNNFKIDKIIDNNNYFVLNYKDIKFLNLNNYFKENDEENTKSSVLYFKYLNLSFLLTGDAPIDIEEKIINDYNYDIDILKVGHHGSNTSTSKEFIRHFKPEVAIISVGRNNIYNHPHSDVIDTLKDENIVIFRTDLDGSIKISKNIFNEVIINTKY